jgi:hypothetical protein
MPHRVARSCIPGAQERSAYRLRCHFACDSLLFVWINEFGENGTTGCENMYHDSIN